MIKVLITGGNGDIAKELKKLLVENKYEVCAPSRLEMDVTNLDMIEKIISDFNPNVLVNNAGYVVPKSIKEHDIENSIKHIDINYGSNSFFIALNKTLAKSTGSSKVSWSSLGNKFFLILVFVLPGEIQTA